MMEMPKRLQVKVGSFVLIGIFALSLSVFFLGSKASLFSSTTNYRVLFPVVQGLASGSLVSIAGLHAGSVEKLNLAPDGSGVIVEFSILEEFTSVLTEGTQAEMRTQGALGDKFLFLTPGPQNSPPLTPQALLRGKPTADLFSALSSKSEKLDEIFATAQSLRLLSETLRDQSHIVFASIDRVASSVETVAKEASKTTQMTREVLKALNDASKPLVGSLNKLDSLLLSIESQEGTLGSLIKDPSLHRDLLNWIGNRRDKTYVRSLLKHTVDQSTASSPPRDIKE